MKIQHIGVKNFRLLHDVTLSLDKDTTVIVGRNNSGKTSLTELMRRLIGDKSPSFRLEDFSLCVHEDFWKAFKLFSEGADEPTVRAALPTIEVYLKIQYDAASTSLGALSDFIIDLDPASVIAQIKISYQLGDGRIATLFQELNYEDAEKSKFYKTLKERLSGLYGIQLYAIDPTDAENIKHLEWSRLHAFLKSDYINAQRGLDDETYKDKDVLGKILEVLFNSANSDEASETDKEIAEKLKEAVDGLQANIESNFTENLGRFLPAFSLFGYPGLNDPGLQTETVLDVNRLLKDHTRIKYKGSGNVTLPESFNGLGARNLIYILFKLFGFFKDFQANKGESGVHLIFIEEPEAHLHPQMQEVFIKKLSTIARVFSDAFGGSEWRIQFVISTHSSHIANSAQLDAIRYFITKVISDTVPFGHTQIKDLKTGLEGTPEEVTTFLHKYMTLTRCDLLFADKAILIEGPTERIILPVMIDKNDSGRSPEKCLSSQYVTIMEVGGAYAKNFIGLLKFLEIKALIITDIDTTIQDRSSGKTKYKSCKVSTSTHTSNATIKDWFGITASVASSTLIAKTPAEKTKDNVYITYQLPETSGEPCGRSFEGCFMLANKDLFDDITATDFNALEDEVWEETSGVKKTEFALTYSIVKKDWQIPKYIKEGLDWLVDYTAPIASVATAPATATATPEPVKPKTKSKPKSKSK